MHILRIYIYIIIEFVFDVTIFNLNILIFNNELIC